MTANEEATGLDHDIERLAERERRLRFDRFDADTAFDLGTRLLARMVLPMQRFSVFGGSFPLRLQGGACIGAATVSGVLQRQSHALGAEVLAETCCVPFAEVALAECADSPD